MGDQELIAHFAHIDPTYVDGVAGIYAIGTSNICMLFYRLQPIAIENGKMRAERVPAVNIIRPRDSFTLCNQSCAFARLVQSTAPEVQFRINH